VEGSSNATVEAMACGLPVIVSRGEFNDDIVDDACAIRVDPTDFSAIRQAIQRLRDDPGRRESMAAAAKRKAASLDINRRARSILDWMEERIAESCL
jgi:glycosyltransferase involved in cell wall biosynthesis